MLSTKKTSSLPYPVYLWIVAALAVGGLANAIYLSISHYRVYTDIGYISFCAISRAINCDTVSQSPYSILWNVPVPIWGVIGHVFFLLFLPFALDPEARKKRIWTILLSISLLFCLFNVFLALVSTYIIHSYCIMCIVNYIISFALLFSSWIVRRRFEAEKPLTALKLDILFLLEQKGKTLKLFTPFVVLTIAVMLFIPDYWTLPVAPIKSHISTGMTEDGHPWIGAENPEITIVEFSDYQCFQCQKMHFFIRQLIARKPNKVRLVHRHYPMDDEFNPIVKEPFHIGSARMALLAIHAAAENKFWIMNDILFQKGRQKTVIDIHELAKETGLDAKELSRAVNNIKYRHQLTVDIWQGMQYMITGTPGFVIDEEVYLGQIPPDIVKNILN